MGTCDRHIEVVNKLDDHEKRIGNLEINEAKSGEKINNLIEKIENLMTWIKALVMLGITTFAGFFIWYIQTIGR